MAHTYIFSVLGNVGVGKTTVLMEMKRAFNNRGYSSDIEAHFIEEPMVMLKPHFEVFCQNPAAADTWQFQQLLHFYHSIQKYKTECKAKVLLLFFERSPYCSYDVFYPIQRKHMRAGAHEVYRHMYAYTIKEWSNASYIYLRSSTSILRRNTLTRSREGEEISDLYFEALQMNYEALVKWLKCPIKDVTNLQWQEIKPFSEKLLDMFLLKVKKEFF